MAIATKQEVMEALKESREKEEPTFSLIEMVQEYFELRGKFDRDFDHYISWSSFEDEDASIDFEDDDWLTIQWTERGRCGDHDYFTETFPTEHLWSDEWEADARKQAQEAEERRKREAEERRRREAEALERREREQLRRLLAKYPDEARG